MRIKQPFVVGKVGLGRSQAFSKCLVYRGSNSVQTQSLAKTAAMCYIYIFATELKAVS